MLATGIICNFHHVCGDDNSAATTAYIDFMDIVTIYIIDCNI